MTLRRSCAARLRDVRQVQLRLAARDFVSAVSIVAARTAIATRIGELRTELTVAAGTAPGYHVKAAAATRAGLAAAAVRQAAAVVDSEARRIELANDVRRRRAATDAVERAIDSIDLLNGKVG